MYNFNAKKVKDELVQWLRDYFNNNDNPLNAVVGCSGGKDSSVVLAALVEAIGVDRIYAILMPNGVQNDIKDSYKICEFLGLKPHLCNIFEAYNGVLNSIKEGVDVTLTEQTKINLAPVIRMATLKAISQSVNGRFTCNGNLSEAYLGWYTLDGDDRGAIKPLANLTVTEVIAVGKELGLPDWVINKTPSDGLCGSSDEEKMNISYSKVDKYIREGIIDDIEMQKRIEELHTKNEFKLKPMPCFEFSI